MEWIRKNYGWESAWFILLDLTLEEYKDYREERRPCLPDIGKQHKLYLYNEGNSEYYDMPFLYDRLKSDLFDSDKEKGAIEKWEKFLDNWQSNENFPKSRKLYQGESCSTSVDDKEQSQGHDPEWALL